MKNMKEFSITAIITVLLVLIIAFCISGTVIGQNRSNAGAEEQYYRVAEREYVQEVRKLLEEKGYCNCGITMNRVIEENGTRRYTVTIHHRRIENLNDEQRNALALECQAIDFSAENCSIFHEFLDIDL